MRKRAFLLLVGALSFIAMGGLLVAHTAGMVVPPSYVGQTTIAVSSPQVVAPNVSVADSDTDTNSTVPADAVSTELVASAPAPSDGGELVNATLTSLGNPLAGETVGFYLGAGTTGSALSAAITDPEGSASCVLDAAQTDAVSGQGYTATFEENQGLASSIATWLGANSITGNPVVISTSETGTAPSGP